MKKLRITLLPLALTLASLSLGAAPTHPGGEVPDAQNSVDITQIKNGVNPPPTTLVFKDNDVSTSASSSQYDSTPDSSRPNRNDRATGIIGMTVRNQNDERLGKVKDIVFDTKSDRVAYVVMSASGSGTLGFSEKQLAVPMNAFTASADHQSLILQADKAQIASASGIDQNNWPSATNPSWGAQPFWESDQANTQPDTQTEKSTDRPVKYDNSDSRDFQSSDTIRSDSWKLQTPRARAES